MLGFRDLIDAAIVPLPVAIRAEFEDAIERVAETAPAERERAFKCDSRLFHDRMIAAREDAA